MRIGITGGIGAGKSYVAHLLTEFFGIPVYDCDSQARRLMVASASIRRQLTRLVPDAYDSSGQLNRLALAAYLFASEDHAQQVNRIVHPAVKADFLRWAEAQERAAAPGRSAPVAMESAILLEAGFGDVVDRVLLVDAPLEVRIGRAMRRDGVSEQLVRARIARQQADNPQLRQQADAVVVNDGRDLLPELRTIIYSQIINDTQNHA